MKRSRPELSGYVVRAPVQQDAAEHRGTGLARHLMAVVLGGRPAYLWVDGGSMRAITFYERHGFLADGHEAVDKSDGITEVRMVRHG